MSVTRNDNVHEQTSSELDRINFDITAHCVCLSYARLGRILGQANAPNQVKLALAEEELTCRGSLGGFTFLSRLKAKSLANRRILSPFHYIDALTAFCNFF